MSDGFDDSRAPERLEDQPFDEAHFVDDPEDIASNLAVTPVSSRVEVGGINDDDDSADGMPRMGQRGDSPPQHGDADDSDGYYDDHDELNNPLHAARDDVDDDDDDDDYGRNGNDPARFDDDDDDGGGDDDDSGDPRQRGYGGRLDDHIEGGGGLADRGDAEDVVVKGQYDPSEYDTLNVGQDVRDLFDFITAFTPRITDIGTKLDPFIPDYIPAVGDIDAMIKIGAPAPIDGAADDTLGLEVIDEPCAAQSDPTVLDLQLRAISKTTTKTAVQVKQIGDLQKNAKQLDNWISSITDLHREKPPQSIQYSHPMPDLELLMQEWPAQVEELLKSIELPGADLDIPLSSYVSIVCSVLDIPVHKSKIEALHLLFSLFVEFKQSQGFRSKEDESAAAAVAAANEPDVMTFD